MHLSLKQLFVKIIDTKNTIICNLNQIKICEIVSYVKKKNRHAHDG